MTMTEIRPALDTRAVEILVRAGTLFMCAHCTTQVKFQARRKNTAVICNVYGKRPRRWLRVEIFHPSCYESAGEPYGLVDRSKAKVL